MHLIQAEKIFVKGISEGFNTVMIAPDK